MLCVGRNGAGELPDGRTGKRGNWALDIGHSLVIGHWFIGHLPPPLRTHRKRGRTAPFSAAAILKQAVTA